MSITNLYYVMHESDGDNYDLFVSARDYPEAVNLWREHWKMDGAENLPEDGLRVAMVPNVSDEPRAHPWHTEVEIA